MYCVKNVKYFNGGPENTGFNLDLYRDEVKLAESDVGWGGSLRITWCCSLKEQLNFSSYCVSLPNVEFCGMSLPMDEDMFIGELLDKANAARQSEPIAVNP